MIAEERRSRLLRELQLRSSISVSEFATNMGVSGMTVRRDLAALEAEGLLVRVHGGAVPARQSSMSDRFASGSKEPLVTLGAVLPSSGYYFPAVLRGVQEAAAAHRARLVLGVSSYTPELEVLQIERLVEAGVDGLLITPSRSFNDDPSTYEYLARITTPTMVMEREITSVDPDLTLETVRTDHTQGAYLAVSHLVRQGDRRIAFLWRPSPTAEQVKIGFYRALEAMAPDGCALDFEIAAADAAPIAAHARLREVMHACRDQDVHAVMILPDEVGIAFMDLLHDHGLSVPRDMRIIAYDDELASLARIPLTAIAPPKLDVGRLAATLCIERIAGRGAIAAIRAARTRTALLPVLVRRNSA